MVVVGSGADGAFVDEAAPAALLELAAPYAALVDEAAPAALFELAASDVL